VVVIVSSVRASHQKLPSNSFKEMKESDQSDPRVKTNTGMRGLDERRRARRRLRTMGDMELGNRGHLFEESDISDGRDIDHCAFDGVGRDAEP